LCESTKRKPFLDALHKIKLFGLRITFSHILSHSRSKDFRFSRDDKLHVEFLFAMDYTEKHIYQKFDFNKVGWSNEKLL
jgi:hypothetical protein